MEINKDYFILGDPIETKHGLVRFLLFREQYRNNMELALISMNVLHFYHHFRKIDDGKDSNFTEAVEEIKKSPLIEVVHLQENVLNAYRKIFKMVLTTDGDNNYKTDRKIDEILSNERDFMEMRELVMKMNLLTENEVSPNPEIQEGIERSQKMKSLKSNNQTLASIMTSIVAGTPNSFEDVKKMTIYQVYSLFHRISAFKNHDAEVLFASTGQLKEISSWSEDIDLFKENDSSAIKRSTFESKSQDLF